MVLEDITELYDSRNRPISIAYPHEPDLVTTPLKHEASEDFTERKQRLHGTGPRIYGFCIAVSGREVPEATAP